MAEEGEASWCPREDQRWSPRNAGWADVELHGTHEDACTMSRPVCLLSILHHRHAPIPCQQAWGATGETKYMQRHRYSARTIPSYAAITTLQLRPLWGHYAKLTGSHWNCTAAHVATLTDTRARGTFSSAPSVGGDTPSGQGLHLHGHQLPRPNERQSAPGCTCSIVAHQQTFGGPVFCDCTRRTHAGDSEGAAAGSMCCS